MEIRLLNGYSYINDYVPDIVYKEMEDSLSYMVMNHEFSTKFNTIDEVTGKRQWDGRKRLIWRNKSASRGNSISFSTGLVSNVIYFLKKYGIKFTINDQRVKPKRALDLRFAENIKLRPYQEKAVARCVKRQRGILQAATGAGKTIIAAGVMQQIGSKHQVFLAMASDLIIQTKDEIEKFLTVDGKPVEVGIVGAGQCIIKDITVMTVQSACAALGVKFDEVEGGGGKENKSSKEKIMANKKAIVEMLKRAEVLIFDEVQHAACETVKDVMAACKNTYYRFGLSASPWRDDGADLEIDSHFGRKYLDEDQIKEIKRIRKKDVAYLESERGYIMNISASYLIREGFLVKPIIYMIKMEGDLAPYLAYPKVYKRYIVDNKDRNTIIKGLSNSISVDKKNSLLVLVKQIAHGKALEADIDDSMFLSGSMSTKKRKAGLDALRSNELKTAIASSIFDEGLDVKRLNCLVLAGSGKSSTRALQRIGRVIRPFDYADGTKKKRAYIFDFIDKAKYISNHSYERMKIYKEEQEFEVKIVDIDWILSHICS
jgi:superfamily II DNA or RNA helicase